MQSPTEINAEICKMVGVDPNTALEVTIKIRQMKWPEVTVCQVITDTLVNGEFPIQTGEYVLTPAHQYYD